jgi:hypothetical protein
LLVLAGHAFDLQPESDLTPEECDALARLVPGTLAGPLDARKRAPFRVELVASPPWTSPDPALFRDRAPAVVRFVDGRVRLSHAVFTAEIDPLGSEARLFRARPSSVGVLTTLRTSLSCLLPLAGGLPVHAAAVAVGAQGLVFFGPSGAGKSTLAGLSPFPVLSDELVAIVRTAPFSVSTTGFCRTPTTALAGTLPLRAMIELDKGSHFRIERLAPREAVRRLVGVASIPGVPPLWSRALEVIGNLASSVPCYRMAWSPAEPPWPLLQEALERDRA